MYEKKKIAVIMPAYNAASKIAGVIEKTPKIFDWYIVVDDASTDGTLQVLEKIPGILLLKHGKNRGYGGAQKTLFKNAIECRADYAVLLHDDGQYRPEEMTVLLDAAISRNADVVLGSRVMGGKMKAGGVPAYKYYGNLFLTALENVAFGTKITEFHTGYRAYSRKALETMEFDKLTDKYYFDSEILLEAISKGLKIIEAPVSVNYRENITAANPFTYGLEIVYLILKYNCQNIKKRIDKLLKRR